MIVPIQMVQQLLKKNVMLINMDHIIPFLTYNAIFYSVTSLSTSITSTQNIFNFIIQHKDSDYEIYQHQLETTDLHNKLNIVSSIIKDILKKYITNSNEIEEILHPDYEIEQKDEFSMVNLIKKTSIDLQVPEPVKLALLSCLEVIIKINNLLEKIQIKIINHQKIFLKNFIKINIMLEINKIISFTHIFNSRLQILFEVLKIYKNEY